MEIINFTHAHIPQATALAMQNYMEEREFVPILPVVETLPDLTVFADNGLGAAAFEGDTMVGFLCCYNPWDNAFGTTFVKGTFSPAHAHGAVTLNRDRIYKLLYQYVAEKLVKRSVVSHAITLYTHDVTAINSFFVNGFGLRCIDAIRPMVEIECIKTVEYTFRELDASCKNDTLSLKNLLTFHLANSPCFLRYSQMGEQQLQAQFDGRNQPRYFCAYNNNALVAWIEVMDEGENFACYDNSMQNICGAFCLEEHRGKGVFQNLLNYLISTLKDEGYTQLGVDFESFNPTAYGFWLKYFTAYTSSVVRRIDERILDA